MDNPAILAARERKKIGIKESWTKSIYRIVNSLLFLPTAYCFIAY